MGSELLAVDPAVGVAVLLERSGAGVASATVPLSAARDGLDWSFVGTDDACQTTPTFPTAHLAA